MISFLPYPPVDHRGLVVSVCEYLFWVWLILSMCRRTRDSSIELWV